MPHYLRDYPPVYRHMHPPIFGANQKITPDDVELAKALFAELDRESQKWYVLDVDCADPVQKFNERMDQYYAVDA